MSRALIAGAGIAGLSAALALRQAGYEVAVFERRAALAEFGAGLQVTPNATRVLEQLGALDAVAHQATEPRAIVIRRGRDDHELARLDISDARARWGAPYLILHRADLQNALAEVAAERGVELRLGFAVAGVSATSDSVTLGLKRGLLSMQEQGELAIGADGLRSGLRERLGLGAAADAVSSGRVAFRANVPARALPRRFVAPEIGLRLGPRAHLVHYPLRGASIVNLVAIVEADWRDKPKDDLWDGDADLDALKRAFAGWSRESRDLIAQAESWRAWPLHHRAPVPNFAEGRVALVGDAAHPMVPFLAQGAGQAIEDAGALLRHLNATTDVAAALQAYSRERTPRAGRVQQDALTQGRIYHMRGPLAFARDVTMRALGPQRLMQRYDWIYAA